MRKERKIFTNAIRASIYKKYNFTCQTCKKKWDETEKLFHIHHIDNNSINNKIENLELLCHSCHRKINSSGVYPRISVRVSNMIKIKLQSIALKDNTKPSKIVKKCIECFLANPNCIARKMIK